MFIKRIVPLRVNHRQEVKIMLVTREKKIYLMEFNVFIVMKYLNLIEICEFILDTCTNASNVKNYILIAPVWNEIGFKNLIKFFFHFKNKKKL